MAELKIYRMFLFSADSVKRKIYRIIVLSVDFFCSDDGFETDAKCSKIENRQKL
jgi:hypothetical protein